MVNWCRNLTCCGNGYLPTRKEQIANILTHGIWILPNSASVWSLISNTPDKKIYPVTIYGVALILLFLVSTVFHTIALFANYDSKWRYLFHLSDRTMIFIFIAASYTPWVTLKPLDDLSAGPFTLSCTRPFFLSAVWVSSFLGALYQYLFYEKYKHRETIIYVSICVIPALSMLCVISDSSGIFELSVGGAVYIVGLCFFKLDGRIPFAHAIWHVFVILGSRIHYYAIEKYLVRTSLSMKLE